MQGRGLAVVNGKFPNHINRLFIILTRGFKWDISPI